MRHEVESRQSFCGDAGGRLFELGPRGLAMSKREYTGYQKQVIRDYYAQRGTILLGRLQEMVTELFLAQSPKRIERLWQQAGDAMVKLKIPAAVREHILGKRDMEVLAKNVAEWVRAAENG